jgi:Icc-related predicted phosphoesterase
VKILAVSDTIVDRLYSTRLKNYFGDVDLILGCGDLPYEYLEFLVSCLDVPLFYVPGNHDPQYNERNLAARAEGCENLDRRVVQVKGLTLAGLGGSIRYKPGSVNQYSQSEMYSRVYSFLPALLWNRARTGRSLDLFIAHSPPRDIHDDNDLPHNGFSSFLNLLRIVRPRYFLHGHTLVYKSNLESPITKFGETTIINVYPYRIIEVESHVR